MSRGFNLTAEINLRGPTNIRTVVADIRRQLGTVTADVNVRINPSTTRNITALNQALSRLNTTLGDTSRLSNQATTSLNNLANSGRQVTASLSNLPRNIQSAASAATQLGARTQQAAQNMATARTEFEEFGRQSALAIRRFAAFSVVTGAIYKVTNAISSATSEFISFNRELVRVAQVTDTSVSNLGGLVKEITSLSTTFGVASKDLIQVSSTLAQAGLNAKDTEKALKALALSAMAPSFDNLNDTVEGSIALMRQFNIGAGDLEKALGSINSVAAKFAVESSDIITAIQRTGGVFAAASKGVSEGADALNQFIAVFTSVRATTRESAETIATGLRTIFTRIQRGGTIDALKEYGVVLTDLEGKFVGPYEAVRRLSEGLSQLDPRDLKFSRIVEELGGFRQIGKVIPLIQQFATAQQALIVAQRGQGSLTNDAATAQQALAVKISKVREEFIALIRSVGQSESFQNFIKLSLDLASALIKIADAAKGVLPALTAIAAIRGASFITQFATGFAGGLRRRHSGGPISRFATGGLVPGSGDSDTVPAMLTAGEFVIRKNAVKSIGVDNLHHMNRYGRGGKVYRFAVAGPATKAQAAESRKSDAQIQQEYEKAVSMARSSPILSESQVGAAVLRGRKNTKEPAIISSNDIIASKKSPIDKQILKDVLGGKSYSFIKEPLSREKFKDFDDAINKGLIDGVNSASRVLSSKLSSPSTAVSKKAISGFIASLNDGAKGAMFENILSAMMNQGKWDSGDDPRRPFDFANGVQGSTAELFPSLTMKYIDAKASMDAAGKSGMAKKIANQITYVAPLNKNNMLEKILGGLKPGETISADELKKRIPGLKTSGPSGAMTQDVRKQYGLSSLRTYSRGVVYTKNNSGGYIGRFADGGSPEDTIPALLTPGEFVINKKAASHIGSATLHRLNKADKISGYNRGGFVGNVQKFAVGGMIGQALQTLPQKEAARLEVSIQRNVAAFDRLEQMVRSSGFPIEQVANAAKNLARSLDKGAMDVSGRTSTAALQTATTSTSWGSGTKQSPKTTVGPAGVPQSNPRGRVPAGDAEASVQKAMQLFENLIQNAQKDAYKANRKSGMGAQEALTSARQTAMTQFQDASSVAIRNAAPDKQASMMKAAAAITAQHIQKASQSSQQIAQNSSKTSGFFDKLKSTASSITGSVGGLLNRMKGPALNDDQLQARRDRRQMWGNAGMAAAFAAPMIGEAIGTVVGGTTGAGIGAGATSFGTAVGIGAQFGPYGALVGAIAGTVMAIDGYNHGIAQAEKELSEKKIQSEGEVVNKNLETLSKDPRNAAATQAVVQGIKTISDEEDKIMKQNIELNKPTMIGTALSYIGLGSAGKTIEEKGQQNTAANRAAAEASMQLLTNKVTKGMTLDEALQSTGNAELIKQQIAQGAGGKFATEDAKLRERRAKFEGKTDAGSKEMVEAYDKAIKENEQAAYESQIAMLKAAEADIQRAKAAQAVTKALNQASVSIDRTFSNMESALTRGSAALAAIGQSLEAKASGKVSLKGTFDKEQNILQNPAAYSEAERQSAFNRASGIFGKDAGFIQKLGQVGTNIKNTMTRMGVESQQSGQDKTVAAENIQRAVDKQLRDAFGDNNISRQISEQLKLALENQVQNKDTKEIDFDKLMSETTGLTDLLESEKKAYKALADATKLATDSIALYSDQLDKANAMLNESNNIRTESIAAKASNSFRLTEVLGGTVNVRDRLTARKEEGASRANVKVNDFNLTGLQTRLAQLQADRGRIEADRNKFQSTADITDPRTIETINNFNTSLSNLNNDIDITKNALKTLPKDIQGMMDDVFGELQKKVGAFEAKQQAGATFGEKLVTSTPTELTDLNNTYNLVNSTLNGQVRTIQQSMAAQQAYSKVINDGGTAVEAMSAAQTAFSNENKAAFGMFSELLSVAGIEKPQANQMRADFLETMARSQGMNMQNNPLLNRIIAELRKKPEEDPEIKRLKDTYEALQKAQQDAFTQSMNMVKDEAVALIQEAGKTVKKAIEEARISFDTQQLTGMGLGISRPGDVMNKADGGIVYASGGKFINFKPRGTDTVPAMLSPGEFVVNAQATQSNLPLLQTINKSKGGRVQYLKNGGVTAKLADGSDFIFEGSPLRIPVDVEQLIPNGVIDDVSSPIARYLMARQQFGSTHRITLDQARNAGITVNRLGMAADFASQADVDSMLQGYTASSRDPLRYSPDLPTKKPLAKLDSLMSRITGGISAFIKGEDDSISRYTYNLFKSTLSDIGHIPGSVMRGMSNIAGYSRSFDAWGDVASTTTQGMLGRLGLRGIGGGFGTLVEMTRGIFGAGTSLATSADSLATPGVRGLAPGRATLAAIALNQLAHYVTGNSMSNEAAGLTGLGIDSLIGGAIGASGASTIGAGAAGFGAGALAALPAAIAANTAISGIGEIGSFIMDPRGYSDRLVAEDEREYDNGKNQSWYRYAAGQGLSGGLNPFRMFGKFGAASVTAAQASHDAAQSGMTVERKQNEMNSRYEMRMEDDQVRSLGVQGSLWVNRRLMLENERKQIGEAEYQRRLDNLEADRNAVDIEKGWFSNTTTRRMSASNEDLDYAYRERRQEQQQAETVAADKARADAQAEVKRKEDQAEQKSITDKKKADEGRRNLATLGRWGTMAWQYVVDSQQAAAEHQRKQDRIKLDEKGANAYIQKPSLPSMIGRTNELAAKRAEKLAELSRLEIFQEDDNIRKQREQLKSDINSLNSQIVMENQGAVGKMSADEAKQKWKTYDKEQLVTAKKEEARQIRERKARDREILNRKAQLGLSLARVSGVPVPKNPELIPSWRAKALKQIEKKFYLTGDPAKDIELMTAYGMQPEIAKTIFAPIEMNDARKNALYNVMANQTGKDGTFKYSDQDLKLLSMSKEEIVQRRAVINQGRAADFVIKDEARRQDLERAREKQLGRLLNTMNKFDKIAIHGMSATNPGRQVMMRNNLLKKLSDEGYVVPGQAAQDNARTLTELGFHPQTVTFLYPNQAGGVMARARPLSTGGVVYAADGALINFQSKGTDTVPAMLTPGEFVVNARSTRENLPLLSAINNGYSRGGMVYLDKGGLASGQGQNNISPIFATITSTFQLFNRTIQNTIQSFQDYQKQLASTQPNSVSTNNGSGQLAGLDGMGQFVTKFDQFIESLNKVYIPPIVNVQIAPVQVNITGAEALTAALEGPMGEMLTKQMQASFRRLSAATEGAIPS